MYQVIVSFIALHKTQYGSAKIRHIRPKFILWSRLLGSGKQIYDSYSRSPIDDLRHIRIITAREHINSKAVPSKIATDLSHINILPARIVPSQSGKGAGMFT